ncbi:tobe domain protein [Leptobacterium flavescens]|uniref:Tobe domain protein n=1 Tax=Leptobacterium flavescens TaxID=472055 RepID=A0A6P0UJY9_9FLAO|nr:TOBE domain-containing protein [Leptobacterium flavescens]NER12862.1 tobe domain protein [Leptobacterium flavescens]
MNILKGEIKNLSVKDSLSLVYVDVEGITLSAIVIDTPQTAAYLTPGSKIQLIFKETEVIIGKGKENHISLQNKLPGTIGFIEKGDLLSRLVVDTEAGKITSIITTNAVNQLGLETGSEVTAMIKTNEIMLSE